MSFTVLLYHEIREGRMLRAIETSPIEVRQDYNDNLPSPLFVSLESFTEQMAYLADSGYHTLTLSEVRSYYYDNATLPEKSVLLTFDDCFQSVGLYAYPILKKHNFHAVAFVATGWLNDEQKPFNPDSSICMTEGELVRMTDVFECANHSDCFHTRSDEATSRMMMVADEEFRNDLKQCNENPLIQAKDAFAYPFGLYSERNVSLLRQMNFRLAFTCKPGKNNREDNPLLLKRNVVPYFADMETFRHIVS